MAPSSPTPVTVCVIAKDSAGFIFDCLTSVLPLTTDIVVVVDDRTTDSTDQIAKSLGARVYLNKFSDFASQKNFCLSHAQHDWVLFLDADERLTSQSINEIRSILQNPSFSAYVMPRQNYIFGLPMRHTNWDPHTDAHIWLFRKTQAHWVGNVHEQVVTSGSVGKLQHPKIHLNYQTVEEFISKLNLYTTFEAQTKTFSWILIFIYPLWKFVRHYFVFQGFLDGWHGLFLSYLQAVYGLSTQVKAWEKKHNSS